MKTIFPKDFIQNVLIDEVGEIHINHPYIAFAIMAIGIEFLGKCLNKHNDWNYWKSRQPKEDFEFAINHLESFSKYRPFLSSHSLWDALRNGFSHSFVPKGSLTLSSKNEMKHMKIHDDKLNLKCEDFYHDFKASCEEVLQKTFPEGNKMNKPLLIVPDETKKSSEAEDKGPNTIIFPEIKTITPDSTAVTGTATVATFTQNNNN